MITKVSQNASASNVAFAAKTKLTAEEKAEKKYYQELENDKLELEALANDTKVPKTISKAAKAAVVVSSALLTAGVAKVSLNKSIDVVDKMIKSRFVKRSRVKIRRAYRNIAAAIQKRDISKKFNENKIVKSVKTFVETKTNQVKDSNIVKSVTERVDNFKKSPRVQKLMTDAQEFKAKVDAKLPTKKQVKNFAVNTFALTSGGAAAATGFGLMNESNKKDAA